MPRLRCHDRHAAAILSTPPGDKCLPCLFYDASACPYFDALPKRSAAIVVMLDRPFCRLILLTHFRYHAARQHDSFDVIPPRYATFRRAH